MKRLLRRVLCRIGIGHDYSARPWCAHCGKWFWK